MPPVIIAAGIAAASTLAASKMQSSAAGKASKAQESAADKALAFQREQEASRKANYDRAYNIWNASRNALLSRYGIDIADTPGAVPGTVPGAEGAMGAAGPMPPPGAGPAPVGPAMAQGGYAPPSIGELIRAKGEVDPWSARNPFTA